LNLHVYGHLRAPIRRTFSRTHIDESGRNFAIIIESSLFVVIEVNLHPHDEVFGLSPLLTTKGFWFFYPDLLGDGEGALMASIEVSGMAARGLGCSRTVFAPASGAVY
jgi:hypothetical protein